MKIVKFTKEKGEKELNKSTIFILIKVHIYIYIIHDKLYISRNFDT